MEHVAAIRYCEQPERAVALLVQATIQAAVQIETLQSDSSRAETIDWAPLAQLCLRALKEAGHLGYVGHETLRGAGAMPVPSKDPRVRSFELVARPSPINDNAIWIGSVRLSGVPFALTCLPAEGDRFALGPRAIDPGPVIALEELRPGINKIELDGQPLIAIVAPVE